jgi:hypothetical protein
MTESRTPIAAAVLKVLISRDGEPCFLDDLTQTTGLGAKQIQNCLWRLARTRNDIVTVAPGQAWRYVNPTATRKSRGAQTKPRTVVSETQPSRSRVSDDIVSETGDTGTIYEELTKIDETRRVLRNQDGHVYLATLKRL